MSAERCYRALLRAYPRDFRARYEREMLLTFQEYRRDAAGSAARFWAELLWDVARSAPALRLEAMRARRSVDLHFMEAAMKAMGILATLIGVLEVINSLIEGVAGWPHRDAPWTSSVVLGVLGGVVLMLAGIAMLRDRDRDRDRDGGRGTSRALALGATCLVAYALIAIIAPVMSGLGMLLGICFPIVLLAFLFWRRGRAPRVPGVA
jgi:hypothetical protein